MEKQTQAQYRDGKPQNNSWTSEMYTRRPGETREGYVPTTQAVLPRRGVKPMDADEDSVAKPGLRFDPLDMIQ